MKLTTEQSYALLEKYGCYVTEVCDECGRIIGAVCFIRKCETGVWCSRECRGEFQRPAILKRGRPPKYKNDKERRAAKTLQQRNYRHRLGVEKIVCSSSETKDLQVRKTPVLRNNCVRRLNSSK
jgi:hypothetical protein